MAGFSEMVGTFIAVRTICTTGAPLLNNFDGNHLNFVKPGWYPTNDVVPDDLLAVGSTATSLGLLQDSAAAALNQALEKIDTDRMQGKGLNTAQKCRLFVALAAVSQHHAATSVPTRLENGPNAESYFRALAALGDDAVPSSERIARVRASAPMLLQQLADPGVAMTERDVVRAAAEAKLLPGDAVYVGKCDTRTVTINGQECVIVDTECGSPTVSLANLKAVINPFNWADNYREFFTEMAAFGPHVYDGWTRVLETVALGGFGVNEVQTRLRFRTTEDPRGASARIDYDLDPYPSDDNRGDGAVRYDRGWINMWADNPAENPALPGVRARTRKIIRIDGVDTWKQELVGYFGYSTASAEFLLGSAVDPPVGRKAFLDRGPEQVGPVSAPPPQARDGAPAYGRHFAPTAVSIWADTVEGLMDDCTKVARKWWSAELTVDEVANHAVDTADRLIRAPFAFLDAMTRPRVPQNPSSNSTTRGES